MKDFISSKINSFKELEEIIKSKINKDLTIKLMLIAKKKLDNTNYLNLTVSLGNFYSNEFIIKDNVDAEQGDFLTFSSKNIKIKTINEQSFIEIKFPKIEGNNDINKIKKADHQKYNFSLSKIIYTSNNLSMINDGYISIKLKVELFNKDGKDIYIFEDIFGGKVNVDYSTIESLIEGQKIYNFDFFHINEENRIIEPTIFSSITELKSDSKIFPDGFIINLDKIISLKGKIISFNLLNKKIVISDENGLKFDLKLNFNLMKKIKLNCVCEFYNFIKIDKVNCYDFSYFSDIKSIDEKTIIKFKFIENENNYYNKIKIDEKSVRIEKEDDLIFEIKTNDKDKNILNKKIILEKYNNDNKEEKFESSISYVLEVNKGRTNNFNTYLGKNGEKSHQIYYQSVNQNFIPRDYILKINGKEKKVKEFDDFGNKLKNRITFINLPNEIEDNFYNFQLEETNKKLIEGTTIKSLHLFSEKETILEFDISKIDIEQKELSKIDFKTLDDIYKFYEKYYKDEKALKNFIKESIISNDNCDKEFKEIFSKKNELKDIIKNILKNVEFNNNEEDYFYVKKLSFFSLIINNLGEDYLSNIINDFISLFEKLNDFEFIDRIKIMITFTIEINNENNYMFLYLFNLENDFNVRYDFCKNAFEKFLEIIDNLEEHMPFFQIIHQFNSIIKKEINYNKNMYSGSILTVDDVKLDIFKNLYNFLFISLVSANQDAAIWISTNVIIIYLYSFYKGKEKLAILEKIIKERLEAAILVIFFHECTGHLKTHINNHLSSPNIVYSGNLEVIDYAFNKSDSGFILEHLLSDRRIKISRFYKHESASKLLNIQLYLQDNFNDLKLVLKEIESGENEIISLFCNNKDLLIFDDKKLKFIDDNYESMSYGELFEFFSNLPKEQLEKIKENQAYIFFKNMNNDEDKLI